MLMTRERGWQGWTVHTAEPTCARPSQAAASPTTVGRVFRLHFHHANSNSASKTPTPTPFLHERAPPPQPSRLAWLHLPTPPTHGPREAFHPIKPNIPRRATERHPQHRRSCSPRQSFSPDSSPYRCDCLSRFDVCSRTVLVQGDDALCACLPRLEVDIRSLCVWLGRWAVGAFGSLHRRSAGPGTPALACIALTAVDQIIGSNGRSVRWGSPSRRSHSRHAFSL